MPAPPLEALCTSIHSTYRHSTFSGGAAATLTADRINNTTLGARAFIGTIVGGLVSGFVVAGCSAGHSRLTLAGLGTGSILGCCGAWTLAPVDPSAVRSKKSLKIKFAEDAPASSAAAAKPATPSPEGGGAVAATATGSSPAAAASDVATAP
eukprot:TRINITY_DN28446_c0_g1_i3.p1 TRINITY_DN28446_c0_g1~~TRINITY_DN28446_c0_g1_i3.p1  ORF type:complete len:152 (-),score=16.98 TRINITY_DN28446_c0_g1_i3:413-868(-)